MFHSCARVHRPTRRRFSHSAFLPRSSKPLPFDEMTRIVLKHAFVAAPASRGQDTFRFWEVISLGGIPIVLAGPLDFFYRYLPCVIVGTWANISEAQLLDWRQRLIATFGERPHLDPQVARLLNSSFYAERIDAGVAVLDDVASQSHSIKRGIVNHTCNMPMGGPMPIRFANSPLFEPRQRELGCV